MKSNRTEVTIITASAVLAVLAIAVPIIGVGQPIQFLVTLGGIVLGPGSLACRLATRSSWNECLILGLALNIAALMILSLTAIAIHFWHPKVELIFPVVTCVLVIALFRRRKQDEYEDKGYHPALR